MNELAEKTRTFITFFVGISGRSILIIAVDRFIRMKYLTKYNSIMTKRRRVILIAMNLLIGIGYIASKFPAPIQPFSYIYSAMLQAFHAGSITSICFLYLWTYCSIKQRVNSLNLRGYSKRTGCQHNNRPGSRPKEAWIDLGVREERHVSSLQLTIVPESNTNMKQTTRPCQDAFEVRNDSHSININGGCRMLKTKCKHETMGLESGPFGFVTAPRHHGDDRAKNEQNGEPHTEIDDGPSRWQKKDGGMPCGVPKPTKLNVQYVPCNPKVNSETDCDCRTGSKTGEQIEIEIKQCKGVSLKPLRPNQERNNGTTEPSNGPIELANRLCKCSIYSTTINNERPRVLTNDGACWRKCGGGSLEDELKSAQCKEQGAQPNLDLNRETDNKTCTRSKNDQKIEIKDKPNNGISYKRRRPEQEYARCVKFILLAVILCYAPSTSLYLYLMITKDTDIPQYVGVYTHGAALLNSSLNAVIFLMFNREFKSFTKTFLRSFWSKFLCS